ncbi:hypothetical protein [Cohnella sp. GCM10027633]|uniref:hypothetical protein n=1 Tax=unclassified Cohnella TaxID=2636738 RepID=UPI00363ECC69
MKALILLILAIVLTGCGGHAEEGPAYDPLIARLHKVVDGQTGDTYKEIKDPQKANELYAILRRSDESNSFVSMSRGPDDVIEIVNDSPTASAEPRIYNIWSTPDKPTVEVISSIHGGYVHLNEELGAIIKSVL